MVWDWHWFKVKTKTHLDHVMDDLGIGRLRVQNGDGGIEEMVLIDTFDDQTYWGWWTVHHQLGVITVTWPEDAYE